MTLQKTAGAGMTDACCLKHFVTANNLAAERGILPYARGFPQPK